MDRKTGSAERPGKAAGIAASGAGVVGFLDRLTRPDPVGPRRWYWRIALLFFGLIQSVYVYLSIRFEIWPYETTPFGADPSTFAPAPWWFAPAVYSLPVGFLVLLVRSSPATRIVRLVAALCLANVVFWEASWWIEFLSIEKITTIERGINNFVNFGYSIKSIIFFFIFYVIFSFELIFLLGISVNAIFVARLIRGVSPMHGTAFARPPVSKHR